MKCSTCFLFLNCLKELCHEGLVGDRCCAFPSQDLLRKVSYACVLGMVYLLDAAAGYFCGGLCA